MKKVAILIKDVEQQYEGLRTSLGTLLEDHEVSMIVLDHEVEKVDEAFEDNMAFFDEMEGKRYSDNSTNVEKYGFIPITTKEIAKIIEKMDVIIPF